MDFLGALLITTVGVLLNLREMAHTGPNSFSLELSDCGIVFKVRFISQTGRHDGTACGKPSRSLSSFKVCSRLSVSNFTYFRRRRLLASLLLGERCKDGKRW